MPAETDPTAWVDGIAQGARALRVGDPARSEVDLGPLISEGARERFADRMQSRITERAPDFESRILSRRIIGPHEMESRDANLVGGALNGGTANLQQQLVFRPVSGQLGRAETGIAGLYLASASAHPGGGVHGACGMNAARAALAHHRVRAVRTLGR